MTSLRGMILFVMICSTSIAGQAAPELPGTREVSVKESEVDRVLQEIEPHAREFPVRFASAQQRSDMQDKLVKLLVFLDGVVKEDTDNPDALLRDAVANGFGHNMGCPDCGEKAIAVFEPLLKLQPNSAEANWRYGAFLAQTLRHEQSIPYLQKAASLGVVDAYYTAAMVYISLNDQDHAKIELQQYVKENPKDRQAKGLLKDIEHGDLHIHIHNGPPPQDEAPAIARP